MSEDKYKPTKLEWMALSMQAWVPMLLSQMRRLNPTEGVDDVRVFFKTKNPDVLQVVVRHVKEVPNNVIDYLKHEIEREVREIAEGHCWDGRFKLEWDAG